LENPRQWQTALHAFRRREDLKNKEADPALPCEADLPSLAQAASSGCLQLAAARLCEVPKKDIGPSDSKPEVRQIALLPIREQFVHFVLHRLLQPVLERIFVAESLGSRLRRSREDARPLIENALAAGCTHVVQADIEDFFDHIDWSVLGRQLRDHLPKADVATISLIECCLRQPLADSQGHPLVRRCGLLQGSPISSLLANLYLHDWDLGMLARGWSFVRAIDDICILVKSEQEAKAALEHATLLLEPLGLRFKPAKIAIHDLRSTHSFRFLGLDFGLDEAASNEASAGLRRTLYLTRPETWAGVDGGTLVLREGDRLDRRVPLHRVCEVVLLGAGGISTGLIDRCLDQGIPVSFCTQAGRHHGTLHPSARIVFARIARHHRQFEQLGLSGRAKVAARLVQAKLANYLSWVEENPAAETTALRRLLRKSCDDVTAEALREDGAAAIDAIRGHEGATGRHLISWVNGRVRNPDWSAARRLPHERPDRWNLLLDTLSFLLFNRLHTACRTCGLDPWLGFLHSPENRYPSLVYDLMEPFRARLDRFAVWLVNVGAIVSALTAADAQGCWGFTADGWKALILQFEKQLDVAYAADEGRTWRQLLDRQVQDLVLWVDQGIELRLHTHPIPPWRKARTGGRA
jgi:CRISPR-associated protein Cas1